MPLRIYVYKTRTVWKDITFMNLYIIYLVLISTKHVFVFNSENTE